MFFTILTLPIPDFIVFLQKFIYNMYVCKLNSSISLIQNNLFCNFFFYVYFYLLFMAEFDLCRDKECKYACTAYDISKSCRNEEAEEVV